MTRARRDGQRLFLIQEGTLLTIVAASNEADARAHVPAPAVPGQMRLDLEPVVREATAAEVDTFARQAAVTPHRVAAAA